MVKTRDHDSVNNMLLATDSSTTVDLADTLSVSVADDDIVYLLNKEGFEQTFIVHGVVAYVLLPNEYVIKT